MAFQMDEVWIYHGQHVVSQKGIVAEALGTAEKKIDWSAYLQGPVQIGDAGTYGDVNATLMIGRDTNIQNAQFIADYSEDSPAGINTRENPNFKYNKPSRSLWVVGDIMTQGDGANDAHVEIRGTESENALVVEGNQTINNGNLHTSNLVANTFQGLVGTGGAFSGSSINVQGWKGFDIEHPSKEGHRLRHICLEGPEGAVYYRGRVRKNVIPLPLYWKDLVDPTTITVSLTPIGAHQDVIVKRWDAENIYLQAQGALPINCFFHVFGERIDGERLIPEYEGDSPEDYPGDNTQYSIAGYHYDRRTL